MLLQSNTLYVSLNTKTTKITYPDGFLLILFIALNITLQMLVT